jgi:hypothetical protein
MHPFPGEHDRSTEVQQNLADLFNLAEAIFNFWRDQDKNRWKTIVPMASANLALILDVQAMRLFRSITQDCKRAEAFTANILTRRGPARNYCSKRCKAVAQERRWRAANPDKKRALNQRYYRANALQILERHRRNRAEKQDGPSA